METSRKKIQWKWWIITCTVTILGAGFYTSQFLTNSFVKRDDYQQARAEHREAHDRLESKMSQFERTLTGVRVEQAQNTERSKLIDARLELLLKRSDEPDTVNGRFNQDLQEEDLERVIRTQELRLRRLESDPRVKRANWSDPLADLSL